VLDWASGDWTRWKGVKEQLPATRSSG